MTHTSQFTARRVVEFTTRVISIGIVFWLIACGSARRGEPLVGPHAITDSTVSLGQRAFFSHCSTCHPGGEKGLGPALNDKPLPGWLIRFQVRNGLGRMPAFSGDALPGSELNAIVEYMGWLRSRKP